MGNFLIFLFNIGVLFTIFYQKMFLGPKKEHIFGGNKCPKNLSDKKNLQDPYKS